MYRVQTCAYVCWLFGSSDVSCSNLCVCGWGANVCSIDELNLTMVQDLGFVQERSAVDRRLVIVNGNGGAGVPAIRALRR